MNENKESKKILNERNADELGIHKNQCLLSPEPCFETTFKRGKQICLLSPEPCFGTRFKRDKIYVCFLLDLVSKPGSRARKYMFALA